MRMCSISIPCKAFKNVRLTINLKCVHHDFIMCDILARETDKKRKRERRGGGGLKTAKKRQNELHLNNDQFTIILLGVHTIRYASHFSLSILQIL